MPLVAAKCTECGGATEVDNAKKAAVCQSCGNAFIVEEAINHYYTYNTHNIKDSVVHIHEDKNKGFHIEVGILKKYDGAEIDVVIPDAVTEIGESAFWGLPITSVTIPKRVTKIGDRAFKGCESLTNVTMQSGVKEIGDYAFAYCMNLTNVNIPDSVTCIGIHAFLACTSLTSIIIPNSVRRIEEFAFVDCINITSIVIPDSVEHIGTCAFLGCSKLKDVQISPKLSRKLPKESWDIFQDTPFFDSSPDWQERKRANDQAIIDKWNREIWISEGSCQHCGGKLGFWGKCKSCGKAKDY